MLDALINLGFFPTLEANRKALEAIDPYFLRAKGLDEALTPGEFARALFHINQRRGFKSNRKADSGDSDTGAMKSAISGLRSDIQDKGLRTVGELLNKRRIEGLPLRARYLSQTVQESSGRNKTEKWYTLYIDRQMIENEFEALWQAQAALNPVLFSQSSHDRLKNILLHQRPLKPVPTGRCSIFPDQQRAPRALPSAQQQRILQELNNLRFIDSQGASHALSIDQRNLIFEALNSVAKLTFEKMRTLLKHDASWTVNLADEKRDHLKGNETSAILGHKDRGFGPTWFSFDLEKQDQIVSRLVDEQDEAVLVNWLMDETGIDEELATTIANAKLPDGYGSLSAKAIALILPELKSKVITFAEVKHQLKLGEFATVTSKNEDGSKFKASSTTGEIVEKLTLLPYYGETLQAHVGFGTGDPEDTPEVRFGKIANPTVHVGLNQVRVVVNELIKRYGQPAEIIVELARDLKQTKKQRDDESAQQAKNQKNRERIRKEISAHLGISETAVRGRDIEKYILWEELGSSAADRQCPYSGQQISVAMVLSEATEIDHILPYSRTLDDSKANKVLVTSVANKIKTNRTPFEAKSDFERKGWDWDDIQARVASWKWEVRKAKQAKFREDSMETWLGRSDTFLARALNDTRYLSRIARIYLSDVATESCRVIPGRMTALLRAKLGLNDILSSDSLKNRSDHRHHAIDGVVVAITDQGMLQRFSEASSRAEEKHLNNLVDTIQAPWPNFYESVKASIDKIVVSHKPDHGYQGSMHNDTAYSMRPDGKVAHHKNVDGKRVNVFETLKVIPFSSTSNPNRHGTNPDGSPRAYKAYKGDSNYCIEIYADESGKWRSEVITTFQAYQIVREHGEERLRDRTLTASGKPLVMRLMRDDVVELQIDGVKTLCRLQSMVSDGRMAFSHLNEANVDARNRVGEYSFINKSAGSLQKARARLRTINPIGFKH